MSKQCQTANGFEGLEEGRERPGILRKILGNRAVRVVLILVATYIALMLVVSQPMPWIRPSSVPATPMAEATRLEQHVSKLATDFLPRDASHPDNLDRAAAYLSRAFQEAGGKTTEQDFAVRGKRYRNVLARFGPAGDPVLVVGAHYDAFGPYPGADDNASGVAGILELARLLGTTTLKRPVELVAFTLEEPPHFRRETMGSVFHARSLAERKAQPEAMICLEMIGCFRDEPGSQAYPMGFGSGWYPSRGNFVAVIGRLTDIPLTRRVKAIMIRTSPMPIWSMNAPRWVPGLDFSDHHPYWDRGYHAVMITDSSFYRNPHYHTARDLPETLDFRRMAQVVQGVYRVVATWGD